MFEVNNLHVEVKGREILHGVNLHVPDGELHALFGPNGAGKSVLLMTVMGYPGYEVTCGEVLLNGRDITALPIHERARLGMGMAEQKPPAVKGVRYRELIELIKSRSVERYRYEEEYAEKTGINRFLERGINDGLSGGESKCAELYVTLISRCGFLIMDEPDSGVDPEHLKIIGEMISVSLRGDSAGESECCLTRKSGLLVTHSSSIMDYLSFDRAHLLVDGEIMCSGNAVNMMEQIRTYGYEHCIRCQLRREHHES